MTYSEFNQIIALLGDADEGEENYKAGKKFSSLRIEGTEEMLEAICSLLPNFLCIDLYDVRSSISGEFIESFALNSSSSELLEKLKTATSRLLSREGIETKSCLISITCKQKELLKNKDALLIKDCLTPFKSQHQIEIWWVPNLNSKIESDIRLYFIHEYNKTQ